MASFMPEKSLSDQKPVKCGICLETRRNPRDLSCLHSFCVECLEGWVKKSGKEGVLSCPTCMEETSLPKEGVRNFPVHETSSLDTVDKETDTLVCSYCETPGKPVTAHCLDCKQSMCKTCQSSHQKIKALQDHQVVPIEDVASGKTKTLSEKKYCTQHEGERNKFYCETCEKLVCRDCIVMKQCCRDHDYVTMQEAADKQADNVKKALELCKEAEKKIKGSITECEKVESDARKGKAKLQQSLVEVQSAYEVGNELREGASYYEIISKYDEIKKTLDALGGCIIPAETSLQGFQYPILSSCRGLAVKKQWKQVGKFSVGVDRCHGFTVKSTNDIALRPYYTLKPIKVFKSDGKVGSFDVPADASRGITSLNDGMLVIPSTKRKSIIMCDENGKEVSSFPVTDIDNQPYIQLCVTVDNADNIIVGFADTICIHNKDGSVINKLKTGPQTPKTYRSDRALNGIAAIGKDRIAVIFKDTAPFLRILDYSGNIVRNAPPPPDVMVCNPTLICSSKRGELFVVNKTETEGEGIHMYSGEGDYLGCVTTRVKDSIDIALSPDDQELFVANDSPQITIFQRPY